jgi:MFS family permease
MCHPLRCKQGPVMTIAPPTTKFYGWRVVSAAFVLAVFGWGLGFYGPPVYLHAVKEARGWSLALVSTAVTVHFLVGAFVVANLPRLYRRFGLPRVTKTGALALGLGIIGWAHALEPWQLFTATVLSGGGWVTCGDAARSASHGVQRRQHRRRPVLAAVGHRHQLARLSTGC